MDIEFHVNDQGGMTIVYTEPYDDAETFTEELSPEQCKRMAFRILRGAMPELHEFDRLTDAVLFPDCIDYADLVEERDELADEIVNTILYGGA